MGHYDSDYEFDAKQALKKHKKQVEKAKKALIFLCQEMPTEAPQRILDYTAAINDWLCVQAGRQG